MNITLEEIFEGAFSPDELALYENVMPNSIDIDELKKTGYVSIDVKDKDGVITETYEYTSFDGKQTFTKSHSFYQHTKDYNQIKKINELINKELKSGKENYERCADLVRAKNKILKNLK